MRLAFLLLFFLFKLTAISLGQDFNNYKNLKSQGQIPQKFVLSSTEKYNADIKKNISKKESRRERKLKKEYLLENNFVIDELLLSGKILYNDPLSLYVNRVMDELLKNEPELRKEIEVFVIKSPSVNAFATNNGIIVVNMGLLARLNNEAELAFVLAHEVIHYREKHNINSYVENENIESGKGAYKKTSLEERLLARSIYSQDKETESDLEGLKLFMNSDYDLKSIYGVFNTLDYSHLPFDQVPFKKSFLETSNLIIPQNYFLTQTNPVVSADALSKLIYEANTKPKRKTRKKKGEADKKEEVYDPSKYSTHPAVDARKKAVNKALKDTVIKSGKIFIVSEKDFLQARKIARYENSTLLLQNREYEQALYNTYLLMQENPYSLYLKKCLVKSLYGLSKYASTTRFTEVHENPQYVVGQSQQVNQLCEKISASELNILALTHAWQLKKETPADKEINAIVNDLFTDLVEKYYPQRSYFSIQQRSDSVTAKIKTGPDGLTAPENDTITFESEKKFKFGKKKKVNPKKKKLKFNKASDMNQFAFVDFLQDPEFVKTYDEKVKQVKLRKKEERKTKSYAFKKAKEKEEARNHLYGDALGLNKVVFINPFYYKVDLTKKKSLRYIASENAQKKLNAKIKENAARAGLEFDIIDKKDLKEIGTQGYNDNAVLNTFIDEMSAHGDIRFVNYMSDDMQALVNKYGTSKFVWTGFASVKKEDDFIAPKIVIALVYPILLPIMALDILSPDYDTYFYSIVIDVETGETLKTTFQNMGVRDRVDVLDGTLYDLYVQYKNIREPEENEKK